MTEDSSSRVEHLSARSPGHDPEDPYEDVDLTELPEWWKNAVELFERHDLRPYRPPRFQDDVLKHEIEEDLESEYGIEIEFVCFDPERGGDWNVLVDGETVGTVGHRRSPDGYSVYEIPSDDFDDLIRSAVAGTNEDAPDSP